MNQSTAGEVRSEAGGERQAVNPSSGLARNPNYGRIMSFTRRGSRLGDKYAKVMAEHGPQFVIDYPKGPAQTTIADDAVVDLAGAFGRQGPLVVEVGPGSGEQLIAAASDRPDWNFLALEAWGPGVARTVNAAVREGVTNVRVMEVDAAQALPIIFEHNQPAAEIWTFFPDPWRKARHHKRRIVNSKFALTVANALETGGTWRLATDWANYAWQMRDVVQECPKLENPYEGKNPDPADEGKYRGGFAPRFKGRIMTRFERRGIEAGRKIYDVEAVRI